MSGRRGRFRRWTKCALQRIRREQATLIRKRCGKRAAVMTKYSAFVAVDEERGTLAVTSIIRSPQMSLTTTAVRATNQVQHSAWQWREDCDFECPSCGHPMREREAQRCFSCNEIVVPTIQRGLAL